MMKCGMVIDKAREENHRQARSWKTFVVYVRKLGMNLQARGNSRGLGAEK